MNFVNIFFFVSLLFIHDRLPSLPIPFGLVGKDHFHRNKGEKEIWWVRVSRRKGVKTKPTRREAPACYGSHLCALSSFHCIVKSVQSESLRVQPHLRPYVLFSHCESMSFRSYRYRARSVHFLSWLRVLFLLVAIACSVCLMYIFYSQWLTILL